MYGLYPYVLRTCPMESSDLFSHPYEPQVAAKRAPSTERTENPTFSDQDQKKSPSSKPSS
ncbi:hypothetical protein BST36_27315 [Mycolicibacterium moriokaense]|nr:hypothetical protein BST36_27315 [Mycolicibacterium moriokaense]